ncbi:SIMPL domain-containing protein [Brevundimonas sp. LjRoot202]|uniref:SIMPL domain-containing protein n=1 Tax=Brevundimonas sp. LjRoot202 TaxID=3342281 RepID=UPI003ECE6F08
MKTLTCITALVLAAASAPAFAQDRIAEPSTIIVTGEGMGEAQPDVFVVDAAAQGRGATQAEALRALAGVQARLLDGWPRLEGLTQAEATTGATSIEPRRDPQCEENARREEHCAVLGYVASTAISLRGAPAERAGDALSLASDLGANSARLDEYVLSNRQALRESANRAAFEDARRQATLLAEASGQRLGRIVRIQDPSAARYNSDDEATQIDEIVVTGSRIRPGVSLEAAPDAVGVSARITVVFEIE